ncbi:MAG: hypothetical protein KDC99_00340 [Cyclobacteriaceae bacterium]|nr:hypothetical protein [Cyclobacteriaceae bacterium]
MSLEIVLLSLDVLLWSSFAVAILGAFRWRNLVSSLRIFVLVKITSFSCDLGSKILVAYKITPNHASALYQIIELVLLLWMYYVVFNDKKIKLSFTIVGSVLTAFGIVNWLFIQKSEGNTYTFAIDSFVILITSLYYFYWLGFRKPKQDSQNSNASLFWINSGLVIYLSATLLLLIAAEYIINVLKDDFIIFWTYHNIMGIIANLFFFYGLWIGGRRETIVNPDRKL